MIGGRLATLIEGMQDYPDRKMEVKFKIGKKSKGKGGSRKKKASHLRISSRDNQTPTFRSKYVGFRCLVDVK